MAVVVIRDVWGREERWLKHYSSSHSILLVGDGDFSFSLCLAMAFGSATNIVATSLDSYDELMKKYMCASTNLSYLSFLGASLLHGVDATQMKDLPSLETKRFHRIIYNFPHAGFHRKEDDPYLITMHRDLVRGFLMNASSLLLPDGEIHINHKITPPFSNWKIEEIATECSLLLTGLDNFWITDYPGYNNKRGSSLRCDEPFPLGECRTFKFKLHDSTTTSTTNIVDMMRNLDLSASDDQNIGIPVNYMLHQPLPFPGPIDINCSTNECHWIFARYLNHVEETFGSISYDVESSLREALKVGFETYMSAAPGRPASGYIEVLEQFHQLSILRSQRLKDMLLYYSVDQQALL